MIPKIIHQTWKDHDIPDHIYNPRWVRSWQSIHPSWEYRLWTDADILQRTRQSFPELVPILEAGPGVVRSQIGRFLAMYEDGGLYVDLDYECFRPFDEFCDRPLLLTSVTRHYPWVSDALMMAEPGNPLFRQALLECQHRQNMAAIIEQRFSYLMFTEIMPPELRQYVMSAELFSPYDWVDGQGIIMGMPPPRAEEVRERFPNAYAATYWTHNW